MAPERDPPPAERLEAALAALGASPDLHDGASVEALDALLAWARHQEAHEIHLAPRGGQAQIRLHPGSGALLAPMAAYAALLERLQRLGELETSLHDAQSVPLALHQALIDAFGQHGYDYDDIRFPPGWFTVSGGDRPLEVSLCFLPAEGGAKAVLRLRQPLPAECRLDALGLSGETAGRLRGLLEAPQGLILIASPPGGGKSWTLRALVRHLASRRAVVSTLESAMPYRIAGVRQLPWGGQGGVSLRSATMQATISDPDVLLIDPVETRAAAEVAAQMALSGQLVLAGLEADDAVSAVSRLREILDSPLLAAEPLLAVLAQRLVESPCGRRLAAYELVELDADARGLMAADASEETLRRALAPLTGGPRLAT